MDPPSSQGRMTSNSFAVCFASWAPPALKSGRFAGAGGGGSVLHPPNSMRLSLMGPFLAAILDLCPPDPAKVEGPGSVPKPLTLTTAHTQGPPQAQHRMDTQMIG